MAGVSQAELRAILTLQDQMTSQLRSVKGELSALAAQAGHAGQAAASSGQGWTSMAAAMAAGQVAAAALMGTLQAVAGQVMSAGKATMDFGQSLANTRAMTTTEEWDTYGAAIEKLALRLGKDYPLSAAEAGKAIETLRMKGTSLKDINDGAAEAVVRLAAATGGDLVNAAEVVNAALDTFKMSAGDTREATVLMTGAMLNSGMTLTDYKYGLASAGAVVQLYGGTLEDVTIGMTAMTKAGIEGADAGTSIKSMYNSLIPTTKAATATMKDLGIITKDGSNQFFDAHGKVKSYEEISRVLATALDGLTEAQRAATLETLFGSDGQRAAAVATRNGAKEWGNLAEAVRKFDPEEVAKKRLDSMKGSLTQFSGSAETLGIVLVGKMGPAFKNVIDTGTEMLNRVLEPLITGKWDSSFTEMAEGASRFGDGLYAAGQRVNGFGEEFDRIVEGPLGGFVHYTTAVVGSALTGFAALLRGDVPGAADAFGAAISDLRAGLGHLDTYLDDAAGGVINFGARLAGIDTSGAITNMDKLKLAVSELNKQLQDKSIGSDLMATLGNLVEIAVKLQDVLSGPIGTLKLMGQAFTGLSGPAGGAVAILANFASGLNKFTTVLATGVDALLLSMRQFSLWSKVVVEAALATAAAWAGDTEAMQRHVTAGGQAIKESIEAQEDFTTRQIARAVRNKTEVLGVTEDMYTELQGLTEQQLLEMLKKHEIGMDSTGTLYRTRAPEIVAALDTSLSNAQSVTATSVGLITDILAQGAAEQVAAVEAGGQQMAAAMEAAGPAMEAATSNGVEATIAVVEAAIVEMEAAATAMGQGATAGLEATTPQMVSAAESGATQAVAAVEGQTGAAEAAGNSVGSSLAGGMAGGILAGIGRVAAAAVRMVQTALAAAAGPEGADAHSPSKKGEQQGKDITAGYDKAFASWTPELKQKIGDAIEAAEAYIPVGGQIARVEGEIREIREKSQVEALFRAQEMITLDSEALRLKADMAIKERDLISDRQQLAAVTREVEAAERGTLEMRQQAIVFSGKLASQNVEINKIEKDKIPLQQALLEIERQLLGVDPDNKKAKKLKEEQDEIRKKLSLMDNTISQIRLQTRAEQLELDSNRELNTVASVNARVRREALDDQVRAQEAAIRAVQAALQVIEGEKSVFQANEAVIKNATDNEVGYRERLIAVFKAEGKPLVDRIKAGLELVEQLKDEGKISDELATSLKDKLTKSLQGATGATKDLGSAAGGAVPKTSAAAEKAKEMAEKAQEVAKQTKEAAKGVDALSSSLGKLPSWFKPKDGGGSSGGLPPLFDPKARQDMVSGRSGGSAFTDSLSEYTPYTPPHLDDGRSDAFQELLGYAHEYTTNLQTIKGYEAQIDQIRTAASQTAYDRAQTMQPVENELLRIKQLQAEAERDILPARQELARLARQIADVESGSLQDRLDLITNDASQKRNRLDQIGIEKQLLALGSDRDSEAYKALQKRLQDLQDQNRLLNLAAETTRLQNDLGTTQLRLEQEKATTALRAREAETLYLKDRAELLGNSQAIFQANEAIIARQAADQVGLYEHHISLLESANNVLLVKLSTGEEIIAQLQREKQLTEEMAAKMLEWLEAIRQGQALLPPNGANYTPPGYTPAPSYGYGQPVYGSGNNGSGGPVIDQVVHNWYGVAPEGVVQQMADEDNRLTLMRLRRSSN